MTLVKASIESIFLISYNFFKIVLKPISYGYSECLANMLRCILFTSVYGFAVTEIKIDGVSTEFDFISGVKESVMDIIFNLKNIIFKLKKKKVFLNLKKKGPSIVKAKDILLEDGVKIINPSLIIAHLSPQSELNITIKVEKGKGYVPFNSKNLKKSNDLGGILVDANFSPILKVYYSVEKVKTDLYNDLDKINFFIETNGSISGKKALINSIGFLLYQLSNFKIKNREKKLKKKLKSYSNLNKNLFIEINDIEFKVRTLNCIKKLNIKYLGDLVKYTESDLLSVKGLGKNALKEILGILDLYNLYLGFKVDNWDIILNDFINDIDNV